MEYDPYKILWKGYMCDFIFAQYETLKREYDIARLKYEIFCMEFISK